MDDSFEQDYSFLMELVGQINQRGFSCIIIAANKSTLLNAGCNVGDQFLVTMPDLGEQFDAFVNDNKCPDVQPEFHSSKKRPEELDLTQNQSVKHPPFQCELCLVFTCSTEEELDSHGDMCKAIALGGKDDDKIDLNPIIKKNLTCDKCGLMFESENLLEVHMNQLVSCIDKNMTIFNANHDELVNYTDKNGQPVSMNASNVLNSLKTECPICSFKAKKLSNLRRHFIIMHCKEKSFQCTHCALSFKLEYYLHRHLLKVHAPQDCSALSCDLCGKSFISADNLQKHKIFKCEYRIRLEKCDTCGYTSKSNAVMMQHKRKHVKDKAYQCDHCGVHLSSKKSLLQHTDLHSEKSKHECGECGMRFKTQAQCTSHKKASHTDARKYQCSTCQKVFSYKSSLQYHMMTHSGSKPFVCESCGEAFRKKDRLLSHLQRHSDVTLFHCQTCDKGFVTSESLRVHSLIHGERRFTCDRCGKSFYRRDKLTQHAKTHEKRHGCKQCLAKYTTLMELKRHEREQHPIT